MPAQLLTYAIDGPSVSLVPITVLGGQGRPGLRIVGLSEGAAKETRWRIAQAFGASLLREPGRPIVVEFARPIRNHTRHLDLPIALAIQAKIERFGRGGFFAAGELRPDGMVQPVRGVAAGVAAAKRARVRRVIVPWDNAAEAASVGGVQVAGVRHLAEAVAVLQGRPPATVSDGSIPSISRLPEPLTFADVRAHPDVIKAITQAARRGKSILLIGPAQSGLTMLAKRVPSVLPDLGRRRSQEVTQIRSMAGLMYPGGGAITRPPLRAPHHTASETAIRGSVRSGPGELSLAHGGVLLLDDIADFPAHVLQAIHRARADRQVFVGSKPDGSNLYGPADFLPVGVIPIHRDFTPEQAREYVEWATGRAGPFDVVLRLDEAPGPDGLPMVVPARGGAPARFPYRPRLGGARLAPPGPWNRR